MKQTKDNWFKMMALALTFVTALSAVLPSGIVTVSAQTTKAVESAATPGDADGIYKADDGYFYYYVGGDKAARTGWVTVDKNTTAKLDSKYRVLYKVEVIEKGKYVSKYDSGRKEFVRYDKNVIVLEDNKLHYADTNGIVIKNSGNFFDGKGNMYVLASGGIVTGRFTKTGGIRKYYTYSSGKWNLTKSTFKTLNNVLYYFNARGIATKMYINSTNQYYKYSASKMQLVKNNIATVRSNNIYYFNGKGQKVTRSGWYTTTGGTLVYVNSKGCVSAKMPKIGNTRKYFTYDYKNLKWVMAKATWKNINGIDYYFSVNGAAVYKYNPKSGKALIYKNGKFATAPKQVIRLKNGRLYLFNSKSVRISKAGWYSVNSTDMVCVGSKGYVTMKFSTKSGKLVKYNYSKKKWNLVKVFSYKIGSKTYYFDSKGIMAKNKIIGSKTTGYFYVDETGCRVPSKEIQMAVDFVRQHTDDSMTREQKLKACFIYLSRNYPYLRDYVTPTDASRFSELCIDMLTNNHGNCYRCAATFATVATVLGYKARVTCGKVTNLQGTGFTIHGWTELWRPEDNQWVVYDVSMQRNWPARNYYHVLMKDYYPTHRVIGPRARLTVNKGKVNWRWLADSELGDH